MHTGFGRTTAVGDPLTIRQREILVHLLTRTMEDGYQPSTREIGKHFGISSPNGVVLHLRALARKGWIEPTGGASRAIRFLKSLDGRPFEGFSFRHDNPAGGEAP